jgi:hypothetical protein
MSASGREPLETRGPAEVWIRILHHARDDKHASYMLSLATVCKAWTVRAARFPNTGGSLTIVHRSLR